MAKHNHEDADDSGSNAVRLDKWLWAARFFKTRALAHAAVEGGKVSVNGGRAKPGREVSVGQELSITTPSGEITVIVAALARQRGPAAVAALLYQETAASVAARRAAATLNEFVDRAGPAKRPYGEARRALRRLKEG